MTITTGYWLNGNITQGNTNKADLTARRGESKDIMKRKFFVINETGGYFGGWEEELCKAFCKANGYTYRVEYRNLGY